MNFKPLLSVGALLLAGSVQASDLVVIANPAVGPLTKDQVTDPFLGKTQGLALYDQSEGSPAFNDFYKKLAGRDAAQVKAIWSRIVFSGKGQAPKQLPDSGTIKKAVAADPKGVGYIEKSAADATVKVVLSVD